MIATVAQASSGWIGSSWIGWIDLSGFKMYCLIFNTTFKSCPKLITYLVSKTWVLISFKISSKAFYSDIVCGVNWIGCLLVASWFTDSSESTEFEWSGLFKLTNAYDIKSLPCNSFIIWTKEPHSCSHVC